MLTRPELKSCSRVEILDDRHVILLAERDQHLLTGSAFVFLVPLLDGSRTVEEIVGAGVEAGRVSAPGRVRRSASQAARGCSPRM